MNKNAWPKDQRHEFDVLVDRSLTESATADRREEFLFYLDGAVQARRYWALDVQADIRNDGADRILRNEQQLRKPRVVVARDGTVLGKAPREFGRKVRDADGKVSHERGLFDYDTWDELRAKRVEFARTQQAAAVDRYTVEKLLTLETLVPGAATPGEACERLGTTVEAFLADEAAS
jgi:hypothetical protein